MNRQSNNLFAAKEQAASISSIDTLNFRDDYNLRFNSSSYQVAENALEANIQQYQNNESPDDILTTTKANLVIQNALAPNAAASGSTIQLRYQVKNQGTTGATFSYTNFYLSKDQTISTDDTFLGWNWVGGLDPGKSISQFYNASLSNDIAPGTYYLVYEASYLDSIFGFSSTSNTASREITITGNSVQGYDPASGYGLVNAAAAVAKAAGQNTFADAPDLGGNNWGADLVKAPEAWANGYTGQGIVVAVLDTGVDYNHSDLRNNIWTNSKEISGNGIDDDGNGFIDDAQGWNFANNNNDVMDRNGHGTHVSGTIAGENNGSGVTGVAYGAKIMPVKVLDDSGSGSSNSVADGIYYAVNNGAKVINMSLGGAYPNNTIQKAIEYAASKNVIVVMAAGNSGRATPGYPARYANKWGLAVGAVDQNQNLADFSNRAGKTQLAYVTAPGVAVYSTLPGEKYGSYNGTSMATPHVAGVVALMLSANPNLTDAQIRQIITQTAGNGTQSAIASGFVTPANDDNVISFSHNNPPATVSSFSIDSFSSNHTTKDNTMNAIASPTRGISGNSNHSRFVNSPTSFELRNYHNRVAGSSDIDTDDQEYTQASIVEKPKALNCS